MEHVKQLTPFSFIILQVLNRALLALKIFFDDE